MAENSSSRVRLGIRRAFRHRAEVTGCRFLVEKTCANSLRVPFVRAAIPEAKYIVIVRDGRDAVASALQRWTAKLDLSYVLRKAAYVPWTDVPLLGARFLMNRLSRVITRERRVGTWGPHFLGMQRMLSDAALSEVCAWQWKLCVDKTRSALLTIPAECVHTTSYERLTSAPATELLHLAHFLGVSIPRLDVPRITSIVRKDNSGKWRQQWDSDTARTIQRLLKDTLAHHGYSCDAHVNEADKSKSNLAA